MEDANRGLSLWKDVALAAFRRETCNYENDEWTLLDRQVLGVIRLTLSRFVAHNVVKEKTMTDLMKAFSCMYEKLLANNKVHPMRNYSI